MEPSWRLLGVTVVLLGVFVCPTTVEAQQVHGAWTAWSKLATTCSKTCGGGVETKIRTCTDPSPQNGGRECLNMTNQASDIEIGVFDCNVESCWSYDQQWMPWLDCSVECGYGERNRSANCTGDAGCGPIPPPDEVENCNTWNKTTCPNPCDSYNCQNLAVCNDISNVSHPLVECNCVMDYLKMPDGKCVRPPPTTPTPRPIPTMAPEVKTVATVLSKTASTVLIVFVSITLVLFVLLRVFSTDRIIQMNMEIALLSGHLVLLLPPSFVETEMLCKLVSILLHFFFLACFMFMMLEAVHMYTMVAYVVKKDGYFNKLQNILIGWLVPAAIVGLSVAVAMDDYGGEYHCWLQLNTMAMPLQQLPILALMIMTFTLIEAAGNAEYKPLKDMDKPQLMSAKISQRTNLIVMPMVYAHWIIGTMAEYEQSISLYSIFSILNGWLGFFVFFFHCSNNQQVRDKLKGMMGKMKGGNSV